MDKFKYKAEGTLTSQYLFDLIKQYLKELTITNDAKGINDDYKININQNRFVRWFKDFTMRIFKDDISLENYNKVLSTKYIDTINDKLDIYLQTNVLESKQIFDLKQTLQAINFTSIIPLIDEYREMAMISNNKKLLKVCNDIKYLKHCNTNYILFNSPVEELKPFLSDKVATHSVEVKEVQKILVQFANLRYRELTTFNFDATDVKFVVKAEDFYDEMVTDNEIGEDVERFIRSKINEKFELLKKSDILPEEIAKQIKQIDYVLKKLKVLKIEKMLQELIRLKTNLAQAKEVMDSCKDTINTSTIINKQHIFLAMDNLYYKLSKKCETLQQKVKLKLQLVDKTNMFATLEIIESQIVTSQDTDNTIYDLPKAKPNTALHTYKMQSKKDLKINNNISSENKQEGSSNIASNLYDDEEEGEIDITEDDGESKPEEEIVIDEE